MTTTHPHRAGTRSAPTGPADSALDTQISAELDRVVARQRHRAASYSSAGAQLWDHIARSLHGGKRTRPKLVDLGYRAFGGTDRQRSVSLGCAFELLHTALLIHDDVIDRDFIRRGQPTLSAHYRDQAAARGLPDPQAQHVGGSAAIIAGDLLLTAAIRQTTHATAGLPAAAAVEEAFELGIAQAGAGELEDLLYSMHMIPADTVQVLRMEELKTAGYSFQLPLQCGALLAGASQQEAAGLGEIGCRFGVAYQVIDDILGCFGDPRATGKSVESDLREGKSTVLTALASEDAGFGRALAEYRQGNSGIEEVRRALRASGAEQVARRLAADLCSGALASTHFAALPETIQDELRAYPSLILERSL
ncbi:polyprenyl synthetase family protein [Glutamicibacter sp. BSL13]